MSHSKHIVLTQQQLTQGVNLVLSINIASNDNDTTIIHSETITVSISTETPSALDVLGDEAKLNFRDRD